MQELTDKQQKICKNEPIENSPRNRGKQRNRFASVKALASQGYTVWLGSRDLARGQAAVDDLRASGLEVHLLLIDVTDDACVRQAAEELARQIPHLNLLINNAGIILNSTNPPSMESLDQIRQTYEVNVFGPIRVTQSFLPLLKAAEKARVVIVSSILGSIALSSDPLVIYGQVNFMGYSSSKSAINAVTVAFAKELKPFGIKVYAIEPGHIRTDLNDNTGTLSPEEGAVVPVKYAITDEDIPTGGFFGPNGSLPW